MTDIYFEIQGFNSVCNTLELRRKTIKKRRKKKKKSIRINSLQFHHICYHPLPYLPIEKYLFFNDLMWMCMSKLKGIALEITFWAEKIELETNIKTEKRDKIFMTIELINL